MKEQGTKEQEKNKYVILEPRGNGKSCPQVMNREFLTKIVNFVNGLNFKYSREKIGEFPIEKFLDFLEENNFLGWLDLNLTSLTLSFSSGNGLLKVTFDKDEVFYTIDVYHFSKEQIEHEISI